MKVLLHVMLFCTAVFLLVGCEPTGYVVSLSVDSARLADIANMEILLKREGFQMLTYDASGKGDIKEWKEREVNPARYPGEVYTALMKKIGNEKYFWIEVYINYVRGPGNGATHVLVSIGNRYIGLTVPQVKADIDDISQSLYEDLSQRVGKEHLLMKREEVVSPVGRIGW